MKPAAVEGEELNSLKRAWARVDLGDGSDEAKAGDQAERVRRESVNVYRVKRLAMVVSGVLQLTATASRNHGRKMAGERPATTTDNGQRSCWLLCPGFLSRAYQGEDGNNNEKE